MGQLSNTPPSNADDAVLQCQLQQRHPNVQPVLRLPKVRRPRVAVHVRGDLRVKENP